jgi:hypothetical protein
MTPQSSLKLTFCCIPEVEGKKLVFRGVLIKQQV